MQKAKYTDRLWHFFCVQLGFSIKNNQPLHYVQS